MFAQIELIDDVTVPHTVPERKKSISYYSVELVKEKARQFELGNVTQVRSPQDLHYSLQNIFNLSTKPQEHLVMLAFDVKANIVGAFTVHIGTVNMSVASPRDMLQRALLCNATSFAIAHNHPSGNPHPSPEDIELTKRVVEAGKILGITLTDHIIIGDDNSYVSLREKGHM